MPKQTQSIAQCHNSVKASLKPRSLKIHKSRGQPVAKKDQSPDRSCQYVNTSASTASLSQCERDTHYQCNSEVDQAACSQGYAIPAVNATNVLQYVPQVVYMNQPMQYQVLIPVQTQYVAVQLSDPLVEEDEHIAQNDNVECESCSDHFKPCDSFRCSSKKISVANTAASQESQSGFDEVEIEIPGGFDNILENEMSNSSCDENSEFVTLPKIQNWIGLDWDEVSITSDVSQNRRDLENGIFESHLPCSVCCKKFRNHVELVAHELTHQSETMYKCPHVFCDAKYEKAAHLKSHIRKRHQKHWSQFERALENATKFEKNNENGVLMNPSESMIDALKPHPLL